MGVKFFLLEGLKHLVIKMMCILIITMILGVKVMVCGLELFRVLADGFLVGRRRLEVCLFPGLLVELLVQFFHGIVFHLQLIVVID